MKIIPRRAAAVALALTLGAGAVAAVATSTTRVSAAPQVNIWLENGSQAAGCPACNLADAVKEVGRPGRDVGLIDQGQDPNGKQQWLLRVTTTGMYIADSDANCNNVTLKSQSSSLGTIWVEYITGGHLYLVNRYCSGGAGLYSQVLSADNVNGHNWHIDGRGNVSWYQKITLSP